MDWFSIGIGLGGLVVGAIASLAGVLTVRLAKDALEFEKEKWVARMFYARALPQTNS